MADQQNTLTPSGETGANALRPLFNVCVAFVVIDTVFLILRFYTVVYLRRKRLALTWDDWLLIPAYILNMGMLADGLVMQQHGIQDHSSAGVPVHDPAQSVPIWKALFVITQLKSPTFAFTRFSLLALFLRLFRRRLIRLTCYFLIAFVVAQTLAYNIAGIVQCTPVEYFWRQGYGVHYGHCFDYNKFYRALVPPELFVDVILILLPIAEIWNLQCPRARKTGLTFIFLSGFLALFSNCFRLASYWRHTITDTTPSIANAIMSWCNAEMSVCFLVACVPVMHPLVQRIVPAPIREGIYRCFDFGRLDQPKKISTSSSNESDFRNLVESKSKPNPVFMGNASSTTQHDSGAVGLDSVNESDPPIDLRDIERGGDGVLVRTEIMVTQEELFEDVLGF